MIFNIFYFLQTIYDLTVRYNQHESNKPLARIFSNSLLMS